MIDLVLGVYGLASLLTFGLYGFDKRRARLGGRRVPEARLHLCELLGGWPGALVGQRVFRHKTQKRTFRVAFWAIFGLHAALWGWWLLARYGGAG